MVLTVTNVAAAVFVVIPACYSLSPRAFSAGRLDRALWIYLAAEVGLVLILSRASTGAWVNYGIQAFVFASVLTARALARACADVLSRRASLPIALAALVVLIGVAANVNSTVQSRLVQSSALGRVFDHFGRPSSRFFFAARPGDNRVYGRLDLVYDDWLYPVFESIHLAEPRSDLAPPRFDFRSPSVSSSTRRIAQASTAWASRSPILAIAGIQVGPLYVWERSAFTSVPRHR